MQPEENQQQISASITALRAALGEITQTDLAARLGVAASTIYRYEAGKAAPPLATVRQFAALAAEADRPDLVRIFSDALADVQLFRAEGENIPAPLYNNREQEMVDKLIYILRSGDKDAARTVSDTLIQFERVRPGAWQKPLSGIILYGSLGLIVKKRKSGPVTSEMTG